MIYGMLLDSYNAPQVETENHNFLAFCVFILLWYMLVGQAIYQSKLPSSGNNCICYHLVMWHSREENGSDM